MKSQIDFTAFDSSEFDVEAMQIDARHGNFSPDHAEEYRHENIVNESFVNGQFNQARQQCLKFGLDYSLMVTNFRNS